MKSLLIGALMLFSTQAFATAQLHCQAVDGTAIVATESADSGTLFDFRVSIRGEEVKDYSNAYAAAIQQKNGKVSFLVVSDPEDGIIAVIHNNTLVDATGVYEVETCSISM